MNSHLINECAPLGLPGATPHELSFLERYPELCFLAKSDPHLARQVEASYKRVIEFTALYVAPHVLDIEIKMSKDPSYVPEELLKKACEYGLFSAMFPSYIGGAGVHPLGAFINYEVIATACVGIANLIGVNGLGICCILATFDPRAIAVIANTICENERKGVATFLSTCVTEPGAGSDAEDADEFAGAQLTTSAKKVDGGYLLNGTKIFISNGSLATLHAVMAFDADGSHLPKDQMLLIVKAGSEGLSVPRIEKKMGQKVCPAAEVNFDNVFVPDQMVCRKDKEDDSYFSYTGIANVLGATRVGVGAFATGVAESAYRTALSYARTNEFLGQPMDQQQWVRIELAHLARRAQVARSTYIGGLLSVSSIGLVSTIASKRDPNIPSWISHNRAIGKVRDTIFNANLTDKILKHVAKKQSVTERDTATAYADVAKVSCSELAMENCQKAITLMGKGGLRHDNGAEKLLRDVKLLQIYEGTNQVNMLDFIKRRVVTKFNTTPTDSTI